MYGASSSILTCSRAPNSSLRVRLSPPSAILERSDSSDDGATRSCSRLATELQRSMPLTTATARRAGLDGRGVVDVEVPGPSEAWRRASARARNTYAPRALCFAICVLTTTIVMTLGVHLSLAYRAQGGA